MRVRTLLTQWGGYGIAAAVLLWLIGSGPGWYHLLRLRKQVAALRRTVITLVQERDQLRGQVARFDTTHDTAGAQFARMQRARQELQLGVPGEVVYRG